MASVRYLILKKYPFRFCDLVLSAPSPGNQQPVLAKLQQTFAFLRHTLRALYSPSDFLKTARPPWFESGRQQDCSEFLRYLLDTLQEQEKSSQSSGTFTANFREHRVIEPPSPTPSKTTSMTSNLSPDQSKLYYWKKFSDFTDWLRKMISVELFLLKVRRGWFIIIRTIIFYNISTSLFCLKR